LTRFRATSALPQISASAAGIRGGRADRRKERSRHQIVEFTDYVAQCGAGGRRSAGEFASKSALSREGGPRIQDLRACGIRRAVRRERGFAFRVQNSQIPKKSSLFLKRVSLLIGVGNFARSLCSTAVYCSRSPPGSPKIAKFPVKFPFRREFARRLVRSALRRQPEIVGAKQSASSKLLSISIAYARVLATRNFRLFSRLPKLCR
jgi:hypothetical protein